MKDEAYICKKCGSRKFELKQVGRYTEIICSKCGEFMRYLRGGNDLKKVLSIIRDQNQDLRAQKLVRKTAGNMVILCDRCKCVLYNNSCPPIPEGQYDVLRANFCPNCGTEFVSNNEA